MKITAAEKDLIIKRRKMIAEIIVDGKNVFDILSKVRKNIKGYEMDMDEMSGAVSWEKKGNDNVLFATPFWEDDKGIPFAVTDISNGKIVQQGTIKFPNKFPSEKIFINKYFILISKLIDKLKGL